MMIGGGQRDRLRTVFLFGGSYNLGELRPSFLIGKKGFVIICSKAAIHADRKFLIQPGSR
jgi:hypothetical protein